jgi:hypothetical protein
MACTLVLKKARPHDNLDEVDMVRFLSSDELRAHPQNRTISIIDILYPPGYNEYVLIIMPLLRPFDDPPFGTVGEVVDFCTQIFEVRHKDIHHKYRLTVSFRGCSFFIITVLHIGQQACFPKRKCLLTLPRDVNANNIMMDASTMYPDMYHPHADRPRTRPHRQSVPLYPDPETAQILNHRLWACSAL